ncbi:hypothetical protein ZTR_11022 [Talaromyces verruculosus]|nr:hypothetical protein ZTR_11022 [Talaromyces verruculosus]
MENAQFLGDIATNSEVVLKGTKTHVDSIIADLRAVGLKTTAEDAQSLATNHNWIAEQLLIKSKDDPRFANIPKNDDKKGLEHLDKHLFQTARNINVGTFVTVVLKDYVRMLLEINRENTTAISQEDEKWIEELFKDLEQRLGPDWMDKRLGSSLPARIPAFDQERDDKRRKERAPTDPRYRTYFALNLEVERDPQTHKYPDTALAHFIKRVRESSAGAFGGRQVPNVVKDIEIMGLRHAPTSRTSSYTPALWENRPNHLVRGDRFLTTELNPYNLTRWGYDETQANNRWSFGNVLGDKLLNRYLGEENMPRDSIYAQFMFSVPEETRRNIKKFGMENVYRETRV